MVKLSAWRAELKAKEIANFEYFRDHIGNHLVQSGRSTLFDRVDIGHGGILQDAKSFVLWQNRVFRASNSDPHIAKAAGPATSGP